MPKAPPLKLWGPEEIGEGADGLTLRNCYFVRRDQAGREDLHAHELVHILQWRMMGERAFLKMWLSDEQSRGYRRNRLEKIAYRIQDEFIAADEPFDVEGRVAELMAAQRL